MQPIRMGVIGQGLIWMRAHKPVLTAQQDVFAPVAFCDLSAERRAEAAAAFPGAPVLADADELLALPDIDVALVLTPIAYNAPTALKALRAGKHVIMEKPIARSVAEGRELIAAARTAGRRLFVLEQAVYRHADDVLLDLLTAGEIGDVYLWDRVFHAEPDQGPAHLRYSNTPWRKEADFPLGTLFDGGVHIIAGLTKLFGPPQTVLATGQKMQPGYGDYDHAHMAFRYANGISGTFSHSSYVPGLGNHFYIYGTAGVIVVERDRIVVSKPGQPDRVIDAPFENHYLPMWQALGAAFRSGEEPYYTPQRAVRDVAILEAVARSIASGQSADVEPIAV